MSEKGRIVCVCVCPEDVLLLMQRTNIEQNSHAFCVCCCMCGVFGLSFYGMAVASLLEGLLQDMRKIFTVPRE